MKFYIMVGTSNRKFIKSLIIILLLAALGYAIFYAWRSFPIISGYNAKNACSCLFVQGREEESIRKEDLGDFPLTLGSIRVDRTDSSVTGSVWGMAKRKAIFRKGFGCTLVNDISEKDLRAQFVPHLHPGFTADSMKLADPQAPIWKSRINKEKLDSALAYIFSSVQENKNSLTRAALVLYDGELIAEKYAPGYTDTTPFLGWSVAKTIMGTLIGVLVQEGRLQVTAPAPVPQWEKPGDERRNITTENLLQQTSGLAFVENYSGFSHVTNMLFNKGDMAGFTASQPLKYRPGSEFYYSSGNSNLLSGIIRHIVGEANYHTFPYTDLFYRIGMYHTVLEPDASGTFVGSSYVYASARDYARLGLLYYWGGWWKGEQILPANWVKNAVTPPPSNHLKNYGYQLWLNGYDKKNPGRKAFPDVPDDMFYADGYGGQNIYIIPSKKLVVVRLGLHGIDENRFLKKVIESLR
ncbi:MAG: serine hydrolase domain-containing protein [Flavisolibacter sp.]